MEPEDKKVTRNEIIRSPIYRQILGNKLKTKRLDLGYSLSDMEEMSGIPVNTCLSIEKGKTTNIDYYIEYAKTLEYELPSLFEIEIELGAKNSLSKEKQDRVFLTRKLRVLLVKEKFFIDEKGVKEVKDRLLEKGEVQDSKTLSAEISGVLLNWCKKEEGILIKRKADRKNNVYKSVTKEI